VTASVVIRADAFDKFEKPVQQAVHRFMDKLIKDDALDGLNIELPREHADSRVRTGRVDRDWRAVMFLIDQQLGRNRYLLRGIYQHQEAYDLCKHARPTDDQLGLVGLAAAPAPQTARVEYAPPPQSLLAGYGYTRADLVGQLLLPASIADAALGATSEDALLAAAIGLAPTYSEIILELASQRPVAEICSIYGLKGHAPDDSDSSINAALNSPANRAQFVIIDSEEELRRVIDGGSFARWRVFLHPMQREYVEAKPKGPFMLTGGAGTGKTVVLLHRARELHHANPRARVVLTSFDKNLADSLRTQLTELDRTITRGDLGGSGVCVSGVDALVRKVLSLASPSALPEATAAVLGAPRPVTARDTARGRWSAAVLASGTLPAMEGNDEFFEAEYLRVILPHRITTLEQYLRVPRPGRGKSLNRSQRADVWAVIEAYRKALGAAGALTFPEAAAVAAEYLSANPGSVRVDHVLVDEGQDLSATHWQFLRALTTPGPADIFIAEDTHQRIYGHRVVLGQVGINIRGRSRRLKVNYRTTEENLLYALGIVKGGGYVDMDGEDAVDATGYRSVRSGPAPQVEAAASDTEQATACVKHAEAWIGAGVPAENIAVLARSAAGRDAAVKWLVSGGVAASMVDAKNAPIRGSVQCLTMHRAKGLEFSRVIIVNAPTAFDPKGPEPAAVERAQAERSLVYVAATRARDELVVLTKE
jgi:superfamily I DNA/RNA helicase